MKKYLISCLFSSFLIFSTNVFASNAVCPEGQVLGTITKECVSSSGSCGSGCTYTLNETGTLTYTTTNNISSLYGGNISAIPEDVRTNVTDQAFDVGRKLGYMNGSFVMLSNFPNLRSDFVLPNDIFAEGAWIEISDAYKDSMHSTFLMPENVSRAVASNTIIGSADGFTVYCTGKQIETGGCRSNATHYEHEGDQFVVYNKDGSLFGIYDSLQNMTQDHAVDSYQKNDNGRILNYDGHGHLLSSQNSDGSTTFYDENGNITGFKGKRIYTVEETTLVVKPQGNTFTLRYR